jgi:hypothetical protein
MFVRANRRRKDGKDHLYDLTSTYVEGEAAANPQMRRGYSRDLNVASSSATKSRQ